jgi:KDO2-lipid IV(A) lauroyltransferase
MRLSYLLIRLVTAPFAYLPYNAIHKLGALLGTLVYCLYPKFRKRAHSNLALASDLALNPQEVRQIAEQAMQNLMITCLEYPKLAREKDLKRIVFCDNSEEAAAFIEKGQGVVFFCGHQANWELLFLEGTRRMSGVAIGRPIKNHYLYQWVLSIRQRYGGKIVTPKNAIKEGLRALKKGAFLGVVGDQGMPESGFSSNFLGREAWTSPMPALLAVRTSSPLFVATTTREKGRYRIHYSPPIFPDSAKPADEEVPRLMRQALAYFEESIKAHPGQWLWQHNRWKQQSLDVIRRPYRHDAIAIVIPENKPHLVEQLQAFRVIYPREYIAAFIAKPKSIPDIETLPLSQVFEEDLRFKLIFNFTENRAIDRHFKKLSAFETVSLERLKKESGVENELDLEAMLTKVICAR